MSRGSEVDVEGGLGEGREGTPLLPLAPTPVSSHTGLPADPSASLRDVGAGPSWRTDAAAPEHGEIDDTAASHDDSNLSRGWGTQGLLATVDPCGTEEINRLRGLVDTRLHQAVVAEDLASIRSLVNAGASLASLDLAGCTPLHLCIKERLIKPFKVLLSYEGSVGVRDASGLPLLHVALLHEWHEGARAAINAGADPTAICEASRWWPIHLTRYPRVGPSHSTLFNLGYTPIHLAVATNATELLELLSDAERNGDVDCLNQQGQTALYTAIEKGNLLAVQSLVRAGASVNRISNKNQTALHTAVKHSNILQYLLDNTDAMSSFDDEGLAPIHCAVKEKPKSIELLLEKFNNDQLKLRNRAGETVLHMAARRTSTETAKIILTSDLSTIDEKDDNGDTPLHTAAYEANRALIMMLLHHGADLSTKGKNEKTVLEIIATTFLDSLNFFEQIFDEFVFFFNNVVHVNYTVLTTGTDQIDVIQEFIRYDHSNILKHPFIKSLLYLKMKHLQPLFKWMLGVYFIFLIIFDSFVVLAFYDADNKNNTNISSTNSSEAEAMMPGVLKYEQFRWWHWAVQWMMNVMIVLIYILILVLFVQEILCINFKKLRKSSAKCVYASLPVFVAMLRVCVPIAYAFVAGAMSVAEPAGWVRHAACLALLSTWIQAMFLMARWPIWGKYIPMFWKVAGDLLKVFGLVAFLLVLTFSFCFMIQYQFVPPFDGPISAFLKTLVMVSSEFDYENLFGEEHSELQGRRIVVQLLFVVFVIFGALVLMNFMIGVAVSDIHELKAIGNIRRLEKEVELLSSLECLIYGGLYGTFAKKDRSVNKEMVIPNDRSVTSIIEKNCVTYCKSYNTKVTYCQGCEFHSYAYFLEMYKDLLDIAKKEKGESKSKITYIDKIDVLYDTVVGGPVRTISEEESNRSNWLREVISKQNEQMKSLADNLLQMAHVNEEMKRSNEQLSSKISQVTSDIAIIKEIMANKFKSKAKKK